MIVRCAQTSAIRRIRLSEGSGVGRRQFYKTWTCLAGLPEATSRITPDPTDSVLRPFIPGRFGADHGVLCP
ncbi:hypothetical protein BH23CHL5_BH23CHL5_26490 [soil metagenome]